MLDSLGALGVKRLKPEHRERIPGVIDYCRAAFERQVPFDNGFRMDDDSLYCLELTEKAFRSQGLALSEPVRIGDWEYLASFPLTALLISPVCGLMLDRPITLEQPVYVPGNERQGVWASPLLETVFGPAPKVFQEAATLEGGRLNMRGDLELLVFTFGEVRRSYDQLPARLVCDLVLQMRVRGPLQPAVRSYKGRAWKMKSLAAGRKFVETHRTWFGLMPKLFSAETLSDRIFRLSAVCCHPCPSSRIVKPWDSTSAGRDSSNGTHCPFQIREQLHL